MSDATKRQAPAPPSGLAVARLIAMLSLRRARRGRLLQVVVLLLALPAVSALVALVAGRGGSAFFDMALTSYLRYLIPLTMALLSTASVAEEVQAKTITYLFCRPIPRWALPLGKFLGTVALCLVLTAISITATYLLGIGTDILEELDQLLLALITVAIATIHFGAVASAFGTMVVSYPFAAMTIYLLLVDIGLGFVPGPFKAVSMGVHLTVMAGLYRPHAQRFFMADPQLSTAISLPIIAGVTAVWLFIAVAWVQTNEYRTDR